MLDRYAPEHFYRTTDMALVTFLKLEGNTPQDVIWHEVSCYWIFRVSDGLLDAIDDFTQGDARVEPRGFNSEFGRTKREFHSCKDAAVATAGR